MAAQTKSLDLELSSSQYAWIADNANISPTGDITIEAMIKLEQLPSTPASDFMIVAKWNFTNNKRSYRFSINSTNLLDCRISADGTAMTQRQTAAAAFTASDVGVWVHVAMTFTASGSLLKAYKNGRVLAMGSLSGSGTAIHDNNSRLSIGAQDVESTPAGFFDGKIKNVRIWSVARTQKQIIQFMGGSAVGETGLIAEYQFENDYTDAQGNNDLTAAGSPVFASDVPNTMWAKGIENWTALQKININVSSLSISSPLTAYPINITSLLAGTFPQLNDSGLFTRGLLNDPNIKAYYRFNSGALITDVKGSYDLTNHNTVGEVASGKYGYGADFGASNTNKYFRRADYFGFTAAGAKTFSGWFKISTNPNPGDPSQYLFSNLIPLTGTNGVMETIYYSNNAGNRQLTFQRYGSANSTVTYNVDLGDGAWHHVVGTFDGSTIKMYLDGVLVGSASSSGGTDWSGGTSGFVIGKYGYGDSSYLKGQVDDFSVFSRALSPLEVLNIYYGGADLRFTIDEAGANEVPYDLVSLDTSGNTIEVWVLLPELSTTSTNLYVWGANATALNYCVYDIMGAQSVWRSEYRGVWHLSEQSSGAFAVTRNDSTSYANNLTDNNTSPSATAKIGKGVDFEASNSEYLNKASNIISAYTQPVSFELWINPESLPSSPNSYTILSLSPKDGSNNSRDLYLQITNTSGTYYARLVIYTNNYYIASKAFTLSTGTWHHIVATYNGTNSSKIYVDGDVASPGTATPVNTSYVNTNNYYFKVAGNSAPDNFWDGLQDELRVIEEEYPTDWIKTDYNLQNSPATYIVNELLGGGGGAAPLYQFL